MPEFHGRFSRRKTNFVQASNEEMRVCLSSSINYFQMPICQLCSEEEATKTNSHILPHFLIKTAINKEGSKLRDYELTFSFSRDEFADVYFGQSILPETIEEFKGRELTEEEKAKENPFAQDFLFCPSCEKYFEVLESYYSKSVYEKLLANKMTNISKARNVRLATFEKVSKELVLLLIYSIFFRCSIARYHGFSLGNFERKLRKVLKYCKGKDETSILAKLKIEADHFTYMPFINTFSMPPADDPTKNFVTILHSDKPFFVYLNNVTFHLYTKASFIGKTKEFFYGMTDLIDAKQCANFSNSVFQVVLLSEAHLNRILTVAYKGTVNRQIKFLKYAFRVVHERIFFTKPSEEITSFFIQTIIRQEVAKGERYGREAAAQAMFKVMKTYYQLP